MKNNMLSALDAHIQKLPEIYQPIYLHPEFSVLAARGCDDRLRVIAGVQQAMSLALGRPLRVLDLGCAQGFISLSLAALGCHVTGVDFSAENIAVCRELAHENPHLAVDFCVDRIECYIENIQYNQFDMVLGLSVFHHLVHENGIASVEKLLNKLADNSACLLLELALKQEPLYWASSLPDDPCSLLSAIAFFSVLSMHATHLGEVARPLFFASQRYWLLDGDAQSFERVCLEPHGLAPGTHGGSRRYYYSADKFLKWYRLDHPRGVFNRTEYARELAFLQHIPDDFKAPGFYGHGETQTACWIMMQRLEGDLLTVLLETKQPLDPARIMDEVLDQLCLLEQTGCYHNDLRTWNVMVQADGSCILIDYGSMVHEATDCAWPHNIYLAFILFLHELLSDKPVAPQPLRAVTFNPAQFPPPYADFVTRLWAEPRDNWSFALLRDLWHQTGQKRALASVPLSWPAGELWANAIEQALQTLNVHLRHLENQVARAEAKVIQVEQQTHQQLQAIYCSRSWRLTRPVRFLGSWLRGCLLAIRSDNQA